MNSLLSLLQQVLLEEIPPMNGANKIKELLDSSNMPNQSKGKCAYRTCIVLDEIKSGSGQGTWWDFAGNLRQTIMSFQQKLMVSQGIASKLIDLLQEFQLLLDNDNELNAFWEPPSWMTQGQDVELIHKYEPRQHQSTVIGDGLLNRMTGYHAYNSLAQKTAVYMSMNLPPGYTLLTSLPTGGGKSLVTQMPAFYHTQGGKLDGNIEESGTTVVVVPTVALALDQARAAREYFRDALDDDHRPSSYYGGMPETERKTVFKGVANGNMPLVFISPEAVLADGFSTVLLEAARYGKLSALVIDEAHIVEDWGSSFRPEFQFLAPFRRRLMEASGGELRTILLSATLTRETTTLLEELFSEPDHFIEVRGDALRPELMFWRDDSLSEQERKNKIIEILPLLPRPIILYVTSPEKATDWVSMMRRQGAGRIEEFTGQTTSGHRKEILKRWLNDQIDIMVATSAFGMGVDKADVRCVIHCCMPESVNRFYQEVGRGGRDGYPCLSLLSTVPVIDNKESFNLIKSKILTETNMTDRWHSMRYNCLEVLAGDTFWVDTGRRPPHLENKHTGQRNADFNEITLLFLYRWGLIDILDTKAGKGSDRRKVLIKMKEIDLLESDQLLVEELKAPRTIEWDLTKYRFEEMKKLSQNRRRECWSNLFTDIYPQAEAICGGCPPCRHKGRNIELTLGRLTVCTPEFFAPFYMGRIYGKLKSIMGNSREWMLNTDQLGRDNSEMIKTLVQTGSNNIILDLPKVATWKDWIPPIDELSSPYQLFTFDELKDCCPEVISGTTAIIYPDNQNKINELYEWSIRYLEREPENRVIHLAPLELQVISQGKQLQDLIDGGTYDAKMLIEKVKESEFEL